VYLAFSLTGGPQGAFELAADGRGVDPTNLRRHDPLVKQHKNKDVQMFLKEVRKAVKR